MIAYAILLLLIFALVNEGKPVITKSFHGDRVFRLLPKTSEQLKWLKKLRANADPNVYDFWMSPNSINHPVDIHVNNAYEGEFLSKVKRFKMSYNVTVEDLQTLIAKSSNMTARHRDYPGDVNHFEIVGTFARHADINAWLTNICAAHTDIARCGLVGKSYQGRDILYIQLGVPADAPKKVIFIAGGTHAREWLAHATAVYIINRFAITNYKTDETARRLLETYDFIIVPMGNPDGYEFTLVDRMWRKTRSKHPGTSCYGVDANRNYDISWGYSGTSTSSCSELFRGPRAFSEPETKAMADFLWARKGDILGYFTLHTYGELWLVPYGDRGRHYPADYTELMRVADIGGRALMAVNNRKWRVGNAYDVLYAASGCEDDWVKIVGIKYSYTLELRTLGGGGFVVPQTEIEPSGREVWAGIIAAVDAMQI